MLAVGDAAFQKKCLGKMDDVAKHGRTVLLVSHNTASILSLCKRVIRVDAGRLVADCLPQAIVGDYLLASQLDTAVTLGDREDRSGDGTTRMISLKIDNHEPDRVIHSSSRLKITIHYRGAKPLRSPKFVISVYDYADTGIFVLDSDATGGFPEMLPAEGSVTCTTDPINLTPGRCFMNIRLLKGGAVADYIQQAGIFDVEPDSSHKTGKLPTRDWVLCLLNNEWQVDPA